MSEPVFLTDFGLAKDTATGSKFTRSGVTLGTPAYMSPEQARGELAELTAASDVWACGCLLFELLANRPAFEGESPAAVIATVLTRTPALPAHVPNAAGRVVRACLARTATGRPRDARALADDCDRLLRGERPLARPPAAGRRLLAGGVVLLVAVAGLAAWIARPGAVEPPAAAPQRAQPDPRTLSDTAWSLRHDDPARAAELLAQAAALAPADPDIALRRGLVAWSRTDAAGARGAWESIPAGTVQRPQARLLLGLLEASEDIAGHPGAETAAAVRHWKAVPEGGGPAAALARAGLALVGGKLDDAWGLAEGVPGWEAALMRALLGSELLYAGAAVDLDAVLLDFDAALAEGVRLSRLLSRRGDLRVKAGRRAEGLQDLNAAVALDPESPGTWAIRGRIRLQAGDAAGALSDFESAAKIQPRDIRAAMGRVQALQDLRRHEDALALLEQYIQASRHPQFLLTRAELYRALRRFPDALRDLDAVLERVPNHPRALASRGALRLQADDVPGALADLDGAIAGGLRSPWLYNERAIARRRAGNLDGALADLDAALEMDRTYAPARRNRAGIRWDRGNAAGALSDLDLLVLEQPNDPDLHYERGGIRVLSGDARGHDDMQRALELAPDHLGALLFRAQWLKRNGGRAEAIAAYDALLRHHPGHPVGLRERAELGPTGGR